MKRPEEIIFVVKDDADGGLTARALGVSIFTKLRGSYHRVHDEVFTYA